MRPSYEIKPRNQTAFTRCALPVFRTFPILAGMELLHYGMVLGVGLFAGFVNTLAGGGSLLILPMLIFLGLPPATANGTNRVAILVQNISATAGFRRKGFTDFKFSLLLSGPALAGAVTGAYIAVEIPGEVFKIVLGLVMLLVVAATFFNPFKRETIAFSDLTSRDKLTAAALFFFVGLYGGFIQAGVGFLIIGLLTLVCRLDLVRVNSIKVFVVGVYTVAALAIFIAYDQVDWITGLILAAGTGAGGWIGSHWAVREGENKIKIVLALAVTGMSLKLLGVF